MPLSIDIGSKHIKIAQGTVKRDGVMVNATYNIKLPYELSVGAPLSQIASLTTLLKSFIKSNKIKKQSCSLSLPDDKFLIRNLSIPKGNAQEIKGMALHELVATYNAEPNSIVEAITLNTQEDGKLLVRASAIDRQLVKGYYNMLEESKLLPKSLNYHSNAIAKLMKANPSINGSKTTKKNYVLLDCGMFACTAHVFNEGVHSHSRYLPIGFSDLYYHLSRRNPMGEPSDKTTVYTPTFTQESTEYKNMPSVVTNQIESFLSRLTDELAKFMRTMSLNALSSDSLEVIYLYGGNTALDGLAGRIGETLNVNVETVNTISNIAFKPGCDNIIYHINSAAALLNI